MYTDLIFWYVRIDCQYGVAGLASWLGIYFSFSVPLFKCWLYSFTFSDVLCCVVIRSCARITVYIFRRSVTSQCNINILWALWSKKPEQAEGLQLKISLPHTATGHMLSRGFFVSASILGGLVAQQAFFFFKHSFYNLLQKDWNVVFHSQTECIITLNKTELEKLVHAALWNELEAWTSHTTDRLLLSTGQTAYCIWIFFLLESNVIIQYSRSALVLNL